MAYLQSRSAIARSGVTHCGWTPPNVQVLINGVDRTSLLLLGDDWVLTDPADGSPATLAFTLKSLTPTIGHSVVVLYTTPDEYWFRGTLLQMEAVPDDENADLVLWRCVATGPHWLADRYDLVLARYHALGVNTIVAAVVAGWTDGGFRKGYVSSSFGNLDVDFSMEPVTAALKRVAASAGAFLEITPERVVNLYTTPAVASLATLGASDVLRGSLTYDEDLTQVRTRTRVAGQGTTASAAAGISATTIAVVDTAPFLAAGGTATSGPNRFTYTGRDTNTGPGNLTGVSGLTWQINQGDAVRIEATSSDSAAVTALATVLGGGLSGQATHFIDHGGIAPTEAAARAASDVAVFKAAVKELSFTYKAVQRHLRSGMLLTVSITSPIAISGTFRIQHVTTTLRGNLSGTSVEVFQSVQASPFSRTLNDLLQLTEG